MQRIKKIFRNCTNDLDAILIYNSGENTKDETFFYVTNLKHGLFEGSYALLYPDGTAELFVNALEADIAKQSKLPVFCYTSKEHLKKKLGSSLQTLSLVGLNYQRISYADYFKLTKHHPQINFQNVSEAISKTRAIKDNEELDHIRNACYITDKVMGIVPELIKESISEAELAAEINYCLQKFGADHPAFNTISSFGVHSADPHYSHGKTKICLGDLIVCDFGATFHRYNADITRSFVFGRASPKQKNMVETILNAQQAAFDMIQPNIEARDVHQQVLQVIDSSDFKGRFIHSTGHALGLMVHDGPGFTSSNTIELKENMVFTVEPGIYIPGYGGVRIEDDIRVTQTGFEFLSSSIRALIEIC